MNRFFDEAVVADVVARVASVPRRPVLVGVDGGSGSGKSVFAEQLHAALSQRVSGTTAVVQGDDFYRPMPDVERLALDAQAGYESYFDWRRLRDQVLVPVRQAQPVLRYQRYDWETERLGDWVEVTMPSVVLVEGVYTLRPPLRHLADVAVVVQTGSDVRLARQLARGENTLEWIGRWAAAEQYYADRHPPATRADVLVDGDG